MERLTTETRRDWSSIGPWSSSATTLGTNRYRGKNREGASRPHHAENGGKVFGRTRADESEAARLTLGYVFRKLRLFW